MRELWTRLRTGPWWVPPLALALLALFLHWDWRVIELRQVQPLGLDFLPLWTGVKAEAARLYDFQYITRLQDWLYVGKVRPFVYPPTTLLLLWPFKALPFWMAYGVFTAGSAGLFLWASRRLGADWRLLPLLPPVLLVAVVGQVTFLVAGLAMLAMTLRSRPLLAGVLFGVAGVLKPQALVLLPIALLAEQNFKTVVATGVTAGVAVLASLATGASWTAWLQALPEFSNLIRNQAGFHPAIVSPSFIWGDAALIVSVPVAAASVWFAFRTKDIPLRALALFAGAIAVSPYALNYELAMLAPALLACRSRLRWAVLGLLGMSLVHYGVWALVAAMALVVDALLQPRLLAPEITEAGEPPLKSAA